MPEGLSEVKLEDIFEFLLASAAESSLVHVVDGAALVIVARGEAGWCPKSLNSEGNKTFVSVCFPPALAAFRRSIQTSSEPSLRGAGPVGPFEENCKSWRRRNRRASFDQCAG
ncbi:hypothetical protein MHYP_G00230180 [Metynnis hypsauchen]